MPIKGWRLWTLGMAIVALFGSGVAAAIVKQVPSTVAHPEEWDPRVEPLVAFVERERGFAFDHPVAVEFLTSDEYSEEIASGEDGLTEEELAEAESFSQLFWAVGLVEGDLDLMESGTELVDEGTLAFYSPESKRVYVRGTEMTVGLRVTLVHELTHALQDQHFDLSRMYELETTGEELGFRALVEGDADRIDSAYVDELSESEQGAYQEENDEHLDEADLDDVPAALGAYFSAPYALGDQFVALLDEVRGNPGIDAAFETPPASDEAVLDPFTYLTGDRPKPVATPALKAGEEEFDAADFGALTWLLMLGARIDPHVALAAVDGWGGDAYVAFDRDGTTCLRAAFVGDTDGDTEQMAAALDQWAAAMPAGATSVARLDGAVQVEACDAGADADLDVADGYEELLALPLARTYMATEFINEGVHQEGARCISGKVIADITLEQLSSPEGMFTPEFLRRVQAIATSCGVER